MERKIFKVGQTVKVATKKSKYYGSEGVIDRFGLNDIIVKFNIPAGLGEYDDLEVHFRNPDSLDIIKDEPKQFKKDSKFKVGDRIRVVAGRAYNCYDNDENLTGTIVSIDDNDFGYRVKFDDIVVKRYPRINIDSHDDADYWTISQENMVLISNIKKTKKITYSEWRPKKGEMIEVSFDKKFWYVKEFRVFMDKKYYCISYKSTDLLTSYTFARPIQKVEEKKPEPKFKVGDVVLDTLHKTKHIVSGISVPAGYNCEDIDRMDELWIWKSEEILEKVPTIPIKDGKISFRGKSKGIMVDKDIVMYYSHKYGRILISEAEKPLKKNYVWVECKKEDLRKGDIFCIGSIGHFWIFNRLENDCLIYSYDSGNNIREAWVSEEHLKGDNGGSSFYKAIEV